MFGGLSSTLRQSELPLSLSVQYTIVCIVAFFIIDDSRHQLFAKAMFFDVK